MSAKFFGKYRGVVTNNVDPTQIGRVRAQVPDVFGAERSGWAMPCIPGNVPRKVASSLPKIDAAVWIDARSRRTQIVAIGKIIGLAAIEAG
jgi:hypothetical protein